MTHKRFYLLVLLAKLIWFSTQIGAAGLPPPFELRDGDRVVFLGNSFFERALDHGYLETTLASQWPLKNIVFRNLGWDGDTIYGHSRAGGRRRTAFGEPEEGFKKMIYHVQELKPTVIFLAYGYNESFEGNSGIDPFRKGIKRLMAEIGTEKTRWVFLTPPAIPDDRNSVNLSLGNYANAILEVAESGRHYTIDLFNDSTFRSTVYFENGIHLSRLGYQKISEILQQQLKLSPLEIPFDSSRFKELRLAIVKKNTLYYHRWRPRNDAFVYGERKDEQTIAQTEPAKFEPFIEKQERIIRQLLNP